MRKRVTRVANGARDNSQAKIVFATFIARHKITDNVHASYIIYSIDFGTYG